ncbi:MAG: cell division protein FtsZ, partial [bacterium]
MARRKRASMREGPLADLFRSTVEPEEPPASPEIPPRAGDETTVMPSEPVSPPAPQQEPISPPEDSPERPVPPVPQTADPERVHAYRVEESAPTVLEPKERLSRIFNEDGPDADSPVFGRDDPDMHAPTGPARPHSPVIRVVGVGGAGVNAVNRMVEAQIPGVEFMAINTDLQSLQKSTADVTVHLGSGVARGLGAGSDPELGYRAAFDEQDKIKRLLKGSDMVFVAAGAGGGTG